jgi:hypothetical protein
VTGFLRSVPQSAFTIDFYASTTTDALNFRQGQRHLHQIEVVTDDSGHASFTVALPAATTTRQVVTATATDALGNTSEFSASLGMTNIPPIAQDDNATTDEDTPVPIPVLANDTDTDGGVNLATVAIVTPPMHGSAIPDAATGQITYTPSQDYFGNDSFTYAVLDGDGASSNMASVTITVQSVNDRPLLEVERTWIGSEGSKLSFQAHATDPEQGALRFQLGTGVPAGATIDPVTGAFSWIPSEQQGPNEFVFEILVAESGPSGLVTGQSISVNVQELNVPPVVATIGAKAVAEGNPLAFSVSASDIDLPANALVYSATNLPTGAVFDATSRTFRWTPNESHGSTSFDVIFTVSDGVVTDSEVVRIDVADSNDAPLLAPIGNRFVQEGNSVSIVISASDTDIPPNHLTYSATNLPSGATFDDSTRTFQWSPSEQHGPGDYEITFDVQDGTLHDSEKITITVSELNAPPTLIAIGSKIVSEGNDLSFTVSGNDSDLPSNLLTYSATGLPVGATFDESTRSFNWTPGETQGNGSYDITFLISDGRLQDSEVVTITVNEANQAPILIMPTDQTIPAGTQLNLTASATDADLPADRLQFSLEPGSPQDARIDASSGAITWQPTTAGAFELRVRVSDDGSPPLSDIQSLIVTVTDNTGPIVVGQRFILAGSVISTIELEFSEPLRELTAETVDNYHVLSTGKKSKTILLQSADYHAASSSVTLTVSGSGMKPKGFFALTVSQHITDLSDNPLEGGDFVRTIGIGTSLSYTDPDTITLTLKGGGILQLVMEERRLELVGIGLNSTLSGRIKRSKRGDGIAHLASIDPVTGYANRLSSVFIIGS